jgi:hypothetical protein
VPGVGSAYLMIYGEADEAENAKEDGPPPASA